MPSSPLQPCGVCCVCATGTVGSNCEYWQELARRLDARYPGQVEAWGFGDFMPELTQDDIMSWDM